MRKITRNDIDRHNMIALGYCQCQTALKIFGDDYKVGYNSGIHGWNYDLYTVENYDIITGYRIPYTGRSNKEIKNKLIAFDNKLLKMNTTDIFKNYKKLKKEFLEIFE